jgi:hypothetical protein
MPEWTPARVEEGLRKAATLRRTLIKGECANVETRGDPKGMRITWDRGIGDVGVASADIAKAAEVLSWLGWLDPDDAEIILARLRGAPWKALCWRFEISRPTADRRYRYGLAVIAWHLNGHQTPQARLPSQRSLVGQHRHRKRETSAGTTRVDGDAKTRAG